jgi:AraC-like DNA-binding protein
MAEQTTRTDAIGPPVIDPDAAPRPLFVLSQRYEAFDGPWHAHRSAQFVYAGEGVLTTQTANGLWVVPPQRAVWIVPGESHKGTATRPLWLKTLYAKPGSAPVPPRSGVVTVDRLLDALLTEAARFGDNYPLDGPEQRLMRVIADRLGVLPSVPSYLPMPMDTRLQRLTRLLIARPADARALDALAGDCGMASRTAARLFIKETGLTFAQWRQQLRLLSAMQALGQGDSVTQAAAEVGYSDVSAFIAVFKAAFGETPARYFRNG